MRLFLCFKDKSSHFSINIADFTKLFNKRALFRAQKKASLITRETAKSGKDMTMRSHIDRLASLKETEFMIATDNFDAKYSSPAERLTLKPNVINRKSETIARGIVGQAIRKKTRVLSVARSRGFFLVKSRRRIAKSGGK
ncbi:MAG: hypothetical protein LBF86_07900 [Helicobacteraceae bacterium]|jgi:hypothetical protein|nr:hypothetical protein [Helicobacteraceae bacterium]